jgi:hypothetical protein
MARFDLSQYETVEERIRRFYADNPDGRIITHNLTTPADRSVSTWVVRTEIYLSAGDQANNLPKASGLAFEIDGGNGPQSFAGLEVCETSSIGRALANAGYSGNKRASREEMEKADRTSAVDVMHQFAQRDWKKDADTLNDVEALRTLWANAKAKRAPNNVLDYIKERANALSNTGSISRGTEGSLPGLFAETEGSGTTGQIDPEPKAKGRK